MTIALLFLMIGCLRAIFPVTAMEAVEEHPQAAGAASALMGALQFGMGALASIGLSALSDGTAVPMAMVIPSCALLAVGVNLLGRRYILN